MTHEPSRHEAHGVAKARVSPFQEASHPDPIDALSLIEALDQMRHGPYRQRMERWRRMLSRQGTEASDKATGFLARA